MFEFNVPRRLRPAEAECHDWGLSGSQTGGDPSDLLGQTTLLLPST